MDYANFKGEFVLGKPRFKTPLSLFIATMDLLGHRFILRVYGEVSESIQKSWFDSIMGIIAGLDNVKLGKWIKDNYGTQKQG